MENIEKEVLKRYKLWQNVFEENLSADRNTDENFGIITDLDSSCSAGDTCKACRD